MDERYQLLRVVAAALRQRGLRDPRLRALSSQYTYSNIPVIIGEYGPSSQTNDGTVSSAFLNDIEAKQIPNLAWTFEPYSDCRPSLLQTTHSATSLIPTTWGTQVKNYLLLHAP